MQSLEELSTVKVDGTSIRCIQGLSELANLRVLQISFPCESFSADEDQKKAGPLSSSISKLVACGLESLHLKFLPQSWTISYHMQPPITPSLRKLFLNCCVSIPSQIGSLVNLTHLFIKKIEEVDEEGFNILAGLPKLLHLHLDLIIMFSSFERHYGRQVIRSQGFGCLQKFSFTAERLRFEPGAMPKLQSLKLTLFPRCQFKHAGLSLGLHHLLALRDISVEINCSGATGEEVRALKDDIRGAAAHHPNRPALKISRALEKKMRSLTTT